MTETATRPRCHADTAPPAKGLYRLNGFRVFAAGNARGKTWTEQDIDDMVRNGREFADLVRPTLVIGHEEAQPLADGMTSTVTQNTGEPAFGRLVNPRKERWTAADGSPVVGLTVDVTDIPGWLAKLVKNKAYIDRSAELYDRPPDGLEGAKGPVLRRVALLGGELPQIKTLGDMPEPEPQEFSESRIFSRPARPLRLSERRNLSPHLGVDNGVPVFDFAGAASDDGRAARGRSASSTSYVFTEDPADADEMTEPSAENQEKRDLADRLAACTNTSAADYYRQSLDFLKEIAADILGPQADAGRETPPAAINTAGPLARADLLDELVSYGFSPDLADSLSTPAIAQSVAVLRVNGTPLPNDALAATFAERANRRNPYLARLSAGGLTKEKVLSAYREAKKYNQKLSLAAHLCGRN